MAAAEAGLCEYELQRLNHMRRNHEYLVSLGLKRAEDPIAPNHTKKRPAPTTTQPPKKKKERTEPVRRSARLLGQEVEYTAEKITALDEREELRLERRPKTTYFDRSYESEAEVREATMAYLKEVREAMLPVAFCDDWQKEAVRRWGSGCRANENWKLLVESRLSRPPPVSPLDFLQEYYAADTWRLLVSCVLMSRVSSWNTKHTCISSFFERYATPSAFAGETQWSRVKDVINPLGLFDDRLKSLVALTKAFLTGFDDFQLSTDRNSPFKVHGVGPFAVDSFLVFCRDQGPTITLSPGGKPIAPFVHWRRQHQKEFEEEHGGTTTTAAKDEEEDGDILSPSPPPQEEEENEA